MQEKCHLLSEIQPNLNVTVSPIFFGDRPSNLYAYQNGKKLHSYQRKTESISWNKLRYGNQ